MFERFTDHSRRVVVLAQEEAKRLDHDYIGTEHLLLGLIREDEGVAARALAGLDVSLEEIRRRVEEIVGRGDGPPTGPVPFTPRAKKVLELSLREAKQLGEDSIGTEHILLGLIREGEGVAAQVLRDSGVGLDAARSTVVQILSGPPPGMTTTSPEKGDDTGGVGRASPRCPSCRASLSDSGVASRITVEDDGGEPVQVRILFCRGCGAAIGTIA